MGNVCYMYEYVREGPIPMPAMKSVCGSAGSGRNSRRGNNEMDAWMEQKKNLVDSVHAGGDVDVPSTSADNTTVDDEQFIDVEDLEVVEEEVIADGDVTLHDMHQVEHQMHDAMQPIQLIDDDIMEMSQEDVLNDGYDMEFEDDSGGLTDTLAPYYENARQLNTGHIYLTVRHKRIAGTFESVLEWITNTSMV
uniref:DUF7747 domain-containing protein n=1 Tax=Caenorhabditis japonica TaxID=281687 RepID=A0A8R1HZY8_CAEJA